MPFSQKSKNKKWKMIKEKTKDDIISRITSLNVTSWTSIKSRLKAWKEEAGLIALQGVKIK